MIARMRSFWLSLPSPSQQYLICYCTEGSGIYICLISLGPRTCIAAAAIISSASWEFFFFSFLLTSSMDARLGPVLYLRIPPCSPPGPQPSVPKTDDLPTHPSTHPPTLSSPVQSCPALQPPSSPPKAPGQPAYARAHTHTHTHTQPSHSKPAGLFLLSTETATTDRRPRSSPFHNPHPRPALHFFELLGRHGGLETTIPRSAHCFAPTEA